MFNLMSEWIYWEALCRKLHEEYEIIAYGRAYSTELEDVGNIRQIIGDFNPNPYGVGQDAKKRRVSYQFLSVGFIG